MCRTFQIVWIDRMFEIFVTLFARLFETGIETTDSYNQNVPIAGY